MVVVSNPYAANLQRYQTLYVLNAASDKERLNILLMKFRQFPNRKYVVWQDLQLLRLSVKNSVHKPFIAVQPKFGPDPTTLENLSLKNTRLQIYVGCVLEFITDWTCLQLERVVLLRGLVH